MDALLSPQVVQRVLAEATQIALDHPERALEVLKRLVAVATALFHGGNAHLTEAEVEAKLLELRQAVQSNDERAEAALQEKWP